MLVVVIVLFGVRRWWLPGTSLSLEHDFQVCVSQNPTTKKKKKTSEL